jgi:hypothetical protein
VNYDTADARCAFADEDLSDWPVIPMTYDPTMSDDPTVPDPVDPDAPADPDADPDDTDD